MESQMNKHTWNVDSAPVCADHPAHRATRVASDVIESSTRERRRWGAGVEAAEVSPNSAVGLTTPKSEAADGPCVASRA